MEQELYETELIDGVIHVKKYEPEVTTDEALTTDADTLPDSE
jgi:hypothetical protein